MIEKSSKSQSKSRELSVGEKTADRLFVNGLIRAERTAEA